MVKADLCVPHKHLDDDKEGAKKKDDTNLQDAAVWRQVRSLPKTTESSVSVQQPLVDLARNGSCHNPCSVILFCPRMEIMEFLRFHIYSRHLAIQTRGWSERVRRREQQERKEQMAGAGRWQNMETNISGGRLRREETEGEGMRAMTLQVLVQCVEFCSAGG